MFVSRIKSISIEYTLQKLYSFPVHLNKMHFSALAPLSRSIVYQQAQDILGHSNFISISSLGVKVCQGNLVQPPTPTHSNLVFISPFSIKQ